MKTLTAKNTGVIIRPQTRFGGVETPTISLATADWRPYECDGEWQKDLTIDWDSEGCMTFTPTNNIATYLNWLISTNQILSAQLAFLKGNGYIGTDGKVALSPRFNLAQNGTTQDGNDFEAVWSQLEVGGVVPDSLWPMPATAMNADPSNAWNIYYAQPSAEALALGKEFLTYFDIDWRWLVSSGEGTSQEQFAGWLKVAPIHIAIAVCGDWNSDNPIMGCGTGAQHGVQLSYVAVAGNNSILDHYVLFDKNLASNYTLSYAVQGWVSQIPVEVTTSPVQPVSMASPQEVQEVATLSQMVEKLVLAVQNWLSTHKIKTGSWQ